MSGRRRAWVVIAMTIGWLLAVSSPAAAKGAGGAGTGLWSDPDAGIASLDGAARYFAYGAGGLTIALRYDRETDEMRSKLIPGRLQIPGVTVDGETAGLSGDGSLLVLAERRGWRGGRELATRFVLLETDLMRKASRIELEGAFAFDAISPDGEVIYLVRYPNPRDPTRYEVRAYDVDAERLRPDPILDTRTAPQVMRGLPLARQTSADGIWAYTLYDGAGDGPFVHALNTAEGTALCIDLDHLAEMRNPYKLGLAELEGDGPLDVVNQKGIVKASIDTASWEVAVPDEDQMGGDGDEGDGGVPAGLISAGAICLLPIAGVIALRRRRR